MDISHLREEYTRDGLTRAHLCDCPFEQFSKWLKQAIDSGVDEPNAMGLATVSADHVPSVRTVLLKQYDNKGFVFFTNYGSVKAKNIQHNPNVALIFTWLGLERQIRITGVAEKINEEESVAYFNSRPRGSQIGAWVSEQSQIIKDRSVLQEKLEELTQKYQDETIPKPENWGGYRIVSHQFEFWQGRKNRLHDRFQYTRMSKSQWDIKRLAP